MPLPVELPIAKQFGKETIKEIDGYVEKRLRSLTQSLATLRTDKITQWRRIYYGMPRQKSRSFPWQDSSNLVIQLVGSFVDQLKAKIMMSVFGMDPLWSAGILGEWQREEHAEEQRKAIQDWLGFAGREVGYLNLIPKYSAWISTIIRYGMGAMKLIPERVVEQVAVSESNGSVVFENFLRHDGPVALPLLFEDFLVPLTVEEIERSPFTAQRARLSRFDLERMKADKTYDSKSIEEILQNPDRQGPDNSEQAIEMDTGSVAGSGGEDTASEWDMYECWFPYVIQGKTFQMIYTYHLSRMKAIKRVFNWLPDNSIPYVKGVLGYDGERNYGLGFCEMLKDYQEEVSCIHNRRGDASTLSNTNIFRIGSGTQLGEQFSVMPNAVFPGETGSIEVIPLGRQANETIKDEQITLNLATDRAGIGPSSSGMGAGTVNKKGAYSAMGTFSIMQEGDTRANLNKTEFKQAHYMLGRLMLLYNANFGLADKDYQIFGGQEKYLRQALENVKAKRIELPISAATGSINKEVEKQNEMLLLNNMRAHWQMVSQVLQAVESPMMGPMQKDYLWQMIVAGNLLMSKISRDFGIQDASSILPVPAGMDAKTQMAHQQAMHQVAQEVTQTMIQSQMQGIGPGMPQGQLPAQTQPAAQNQPQPQAQTQPQETPAP
jgi:hypothetical protein